MAFELSPADKDKWTLKGLFSFPVSGLPGADPVDSPTYVGASAGALYDGKSPLFGVTAYGGANSCYTGAAGCGAIYELTPENGTWSLSNIYSFLAAATATTRHRSPRMQPAIFTASTSWGGAFDAGAAFRLAHDGDVWTETILKSFGTSMALTHLESCYPSPWDQSLALPPEAAGIVTTGSISITAAAEKFFKLVPGGLANHSLLRMSSATRMITASMARGLVRA